MDCLEVEGRDNVSKTKEVTRSHQETSRKYICSKCQQEFFTVKEYYHHKLSHVEQIRCTYCEFKTNDKLDFTKHMNSHSDSIKETIYEDQNSNCDFVADDKQSLKNIEKIHENFNKRDDFSNETNSNSNNTNNDMALKCDECEFETNLTSELLEHQISHRGSTDAKPFCCPICNHRTSRKMLLKHHIKNWHASVSKFRCRLCNFSTDTADVLEKHMQNHDKNIFNCEDCPFSSTEKEDFLLHRLNHREVIYKCPICDYKTNKKDLMHKHGIVHNVSRSIYKCSKCQYESKFKHHLNRHEMTHWEYKHLKCAKCNYRTNNKYSLTRHESRHYSFKMFKCQKCNYETNLKEDLTKHDLVHRTDKLFRCDKCDYKSNRKFTLKQHMLDHMQIKLYKCNLCDYGTNVKGNHLKHMRIHENKTLRCSLCSFEAIRRPDLKNHTVNHHLSELLMDEEIVKKAKYETKNPKSKTVKKEKSETVKKVKTETVKKEKI